MKKLSDLRLKVVIEHSSPLVDQELSSEPAVELPTVAAL